MIHPLPDRLLRHFNLTTTNSPQAVDLIEGDNHYSQTQDNDYSQVLCPILELGSMAGYLVGGEPCITYNIFIGCQDPITHSIPTPRTLQSLVLWGGHSAR